MVDRTGSGCAILRNLDTIGAPQDGTEKALRGELARQTAVGRANGVVTSCG
jgi:hypothetical protein